MRIACLHTAWSNVAVFDAAARELGLPATSLSHCVEPRLLEDAEAAGGLTPLLASKTVARLRSIAADADAVLLTCSTLGPAVDEMTRVSTPPILRADAALAAAAGALGGKIAVLCAAETTMSATRALFESTAIGPDALIEATLIPNAWHCFKRGDIDGYHSLIVAAVAHAYDDGANVVALAQASMAPAARQCRHKQTPLTVPLAALAAALADIGRLVGDHAFHENQ